MWEIHKICASVLPQSAVKMSKTYMGWLAVNDASDVTGYQIMIAKNKKFTRGKRTITVDGSKKRAILSRLKKGRIYYVKIRSYTASFGNKIYSPWGKVRQVRAKKEIKEDEIQDHIYFLITAAASLAVGIVAGLLMSVVLYFIDKRIVWLHEEEGPK